MKLFFKQMKEELSFLLAPSGAENRFEAALAQARQNLALLKALD
jgi:IS4 transposase